MEVISGQTAEVSEVTVVYAGWNELEDYALWWQILVIYLLLVDEGQGLETLNDELAD